MIEVSNIRKSFGSLNVLKGINLLIKEGEVVSIVGASGAGKTTLLQIMGTLMKQDEGEIKIHGLNPIFLLRQNELKLFFLLFF